MSLAVAVATPQSIWILSDRELTAQGEEPTTDVSKIVCLDATDGVGLLTYAGAETLGSNDPSAWAASVFEGLDTDIDGYMCALAVAVREARVESKTADPGHLFVATAVVGGVPVIYTLASDASGRLALRRHAKSYAFMLAGSRGAQLADERTDAAEIVSWIKRVESEDAHPREVSDRLVKWNSEAAGTSADIESIVASRLVANGQAAPGRYYYQGSTLHAPDAQLHHMSRGIDANKVIELMKKQAMGGTLTLGETAQVLTYKRRMAESE